LRSQPAPTPPLLADDRTAPPRRGHGLLDQHYVDPAALDP
jgi:hypothetical protein